MMGVPNEMEVFFMTKYIVDEKNGFEYELIGGYYYPTGRRMSDRVLEPAERPDDEPPDKEVFIGSWAYRHLRYLKEHRPGLYLDLFAAGKADAYLTGIEREASDFFLRLVKEMSAREGVTEALKTENQMEWVGRMNNVRERATEIVNNELIYNLNQDVPRLSGGGFHLELSGGLQSPTESGLSPR